MAMAMAEMYNTKDAGRNENMRGRERRERECVRKRVRMCV